MKKPIIAPSLLSADWGNLKKDIIRMKKLGADLLHIDVMDGNFVPNISIGIMVQKYLTEDGKPILPFDTHLMVNEPYYLLEQCAKFQSEFVTVHTEAVRHINRLVQMIRELGMKPGVSINPGTNVMMLEDILPFVDLVLVMSVNPGFGGQKMIPECLNKVKWLYEYRKKHSLSYLIQVDGGIKIDNISSVWENGADIAVSGSGIFGSGNSNIIMEMKNKYKEVGLHAKDK